MLGAGLQFSRGGRGEDRFYNPAKARRPHQNQQHRPDHLRRAQSDVSKPLYEPENRTEEDLPKPVAEPAFEPAVPLQLSNLERFLESIVPSVPAQYLSKTTMRGLRTCDVEFQPYFVLGDLWESFKEWSAYGAGVPLVLNDTDCVVQYYVPYLSGIQIYGKSMKACTELSEWCIGMLALAWPLAAFLAKFRCFPGAAFLAKHFLTIVDYPLCGRRLGEDSDSDFRDSSSDGSSDCEPEKGLKCLRDLSNHHRLTNDFPVRMDRLSLRDQHIAQQEDFSSDEGESMNSQGCLLFEYLERDPPYSREPLADKISDLAFRFPMLKTLRSCDLLSSSWISVAWYPIYRIPTGPTLKDLDACFLTYHHLHTPLGGVQGEQPVVTYPSEIDGVPKMSLPIFGLASYKFKGSLWTPNGGCEHQLANSLLQAADSWLSILQVNHPDFLFFCRR
ncbi:hypothetical protein Tsubulata_029847 [Turnera subulata]|uniref:Uncharacterized protein n=1 Tax=Turnera subulata TaxID=218843 RepID=A0A9Q0FFJ8_9ROSI|nr:hypothetical protein Tsubulata_029847 [Turnera subulata]